MSQPKFQVGEVVILQSRSAPELNDEYPVLDVCLPGESRSVDGAMKKNRTTHSVYLLEVDGPHGSKWWAESALRKRHQPGEYSWQDLKTRLVLPVSRDEVARLDREKVHG